MHIFFSGIGGTGIGPLSLIAHQAGYEVSGSDKQQSNYIEYLQQHGVTNTHIGQDYDSISQLHSEHPIDWFVYSSAVAIEQAEAPELRFCSEQGIKTSKRDEFLAYLLHEKSLNLLAVAGTHGKTTTTAMLIWLLLRLDIPLSYSVGAKSSFADMGHYEPGSQFFVYEADEFDRNFLSFNPYLSIITGIDWDHPDIYPTREEYEQAFTQFIEQSREVIMWQEDREKLGFTSTTEMQLVDKADSRIQTSLQLPGIVNREDAWQVMQAVKQLGLAPSEEQLAAIMNSFPGVARRFERIAPQLYSDYAHTVPKIRGALETAHELAGDKVVIVYEGLHNTRQHFIKDELKHLFDSVKQLYIVPTYLAREDQSLKLLTPADLQALLSPEMQSKTFTANLDANLLSTIQEHIVAGDTVVCISAGGGGSLDEWLRNQFTGS